MLFQICYISWFSWIQDFLKNARVHEKWKMEYSSNLTPKRWHSSLLYLHNSRWASICLKPQTPRSFRGALPLASEPAPAIMAELFVTSTLRILIDRILPYFGKRKQVTYHLNLSYRCFRILPILCSSSEPNCMHQVSTLVLRDTVIIIIIIMFLSYIAHITSKWRLYALEALLPQYAAFQR